MIDSRGERRSPFSLHGRVSPPCSLEFVVKIGDNNEVGGEIKGERDKGQKRSVQSPFLNDKAQELFFPVENPTG